MKKKYEIYWLEYHNPVNWTHCPKLEKKREKLCAIPSDKKPDNYFKQLDNLDKRIEQNGIKNIMSYLPPKSTWQYDPNENDGWIECQCRDFFEAKSIEEAKKIASEYECGDSDIFTVFDEKRKRVFTEEDLEKEQCQKTKERGPYQEVEVYGDKFWDYNFRIKGIIYEISVNRKTGQLFINKDQWQGKYNDKTSI